MFIAPGKQMSISTSTLSCKKRDQFMIESHASSCQIIVNQLRFNVLLRMATIKSFPVDLAD